MFDLQNALLVPLHCRDDALPLNSPRLSLTWLIPHLSKLILPILNLSLVHNILRISHQPQQHIQAFMALLIFVEEAQLEIGLGN